MASTNASSEWTYQTLEVDESLLEVFQEEAIALHAKLHSAIERFWETNQRSYLIDIDRDLHTLKGCAQLIAYHGLAEVCHGLEEAMKSIQQELDPEVIENINKGFSFIQMAVSQIHTKKALVPPLDILSNLSKEVGLKFKASMKDIELSDEAASAFSWDQAGYRVSMEEMESYSSSIRQLIKNHTNFQWTVSDFSLEFSSMHELIGKMDENINEVYELQEKLNCDTVEFHSQMTQLKTLLGTINRKCQAAEDINEKQGFIIKTLDNKMVNARLVDFRFYIPRLEQAMNKTAEKLNKQVILTCQKIEAEVDKRLLEKLMPAFEHLIRNSIDHGIESRIIRHELGKNLTGHIDISLKRESNHIAFKFSDDGQGIDIAKIGDMARKQGLVGHDENLNQSRVIELLKKTGFSTKESATTVSGRGVGVNAVDHLVQSLGGRLSIEFERNKGTTFIITLPVTQSQHTGLLFHAGGIHYFFSMYHIVGITRTPAGSQLSSIVHYGEKKYPLMCLSKYFGHTSESDQNSTYHPVIIIAHEQGAMALKVDKIIGVRDFIIQPAPVVLPRKNIFDGLSLLSDEDIVYGIDAGALLSEMTERISGAQQSKISELECRHVKAKVQKILVVDDSQTVRNQLRHIFSSAQYELYFASDGVEALTCLASKDVDLILTDIEMPRMDGFELSKRLKSDATLTAIPIVMMTSRRQTEDFVKAKNIGIQKFLQKPINLAMLRPYINEVNNG
tara:strand:- start:3564 stop:5759 length:2196 start_codon:yes stop_codon:yes gene_type:complete